MEKDNRAEEMLIPETKRKQNRRKSRWNLFMH